MSGAGDAASGGDRLRLADVERAREIVGRHLAPTPLRPAFALRGHGEVLLKLECWQPTGSYKVRGALALLGGLGPEERARGVVAASAGNHALGLAFAAAALGGDVPVTVFLPTTAPRAKVEKLRTFPVQVHEVGATYDEAHRAARAHVGRTGAVEGDPVENPRVAAGHGTLGLELLDERPDLSTVIVPVGGGALLTGVATAIKSRAPRVRIVAVQAAASPALVESLRLGWAVLEYEPAPSLADGLAGGIGEQLFRHRDLIDEVLTVSEEEIAAAMLALLAHDQIVVEGAGAVAVAALLAGKVRETAGGPVAALVTGANVDLDVLADLLAHRA